MLLPGRACDTDLWHHQTAALAAHRPVVAGVQARADSLPSMAVLLLAEQAGALVLVSCSLRGMPALEAQRQAPDRVCGLAVLGRSARPDTAAMMALRGQAIVEFAQGRVEAVMSADAMFAFHPKHAAGLTENDLAMVQRAGGAGLN